MKALKKVSGKNKGLSKLPTAVRNKMGYMKKGGKVYQDGGAVDPTKKMKKADEAEIDRRYESAVGRNSRTGNLNYPNSVDMDKYESTAGSAGNDNKLRKAVSDKYYAEQRNKMGIDKIKTYKSGGKVVKYQEGGKSVMLDQVVVKGKKGAGVREQGVVARGKTGAEYLEHRKKLEKELTSAYITKKRRHPSYKLNADERDMINDQVRSQMYKDGYQETGVIRKDTKERLSPEMEKAAQDRLRRK